MKVEVFEAEKAIVAFHDVMLEEQKRNKRKNP